MILVVGLGNPGREYAGNRHNIGFMAVDELVRRHSFGPWRTKFQGLIAEGTLGNEKSLVLKPQTFMNLSGESVAAAARFLKVPVEHIVVFHDELDLAPGRLRVKRGGGAGGHNGLRSIDQHLGVAYRRVRLGIGHPGDKDLVSGYVLHDFAKADQDWREPLLSAVAEAIPLLVAGEEAGFMSRVSVLTTPPREHKEKPGAAIEQPQPSSLSSSVSTASVSTGGLADALRAAFAKKKD